MASRRLLAVLIVFILVAAVAIAGGTIFRVRHVEIRFANELEYIYDEIGTINQLRASVEFTMGRNSLFGVDESRIRQTIEEENFRVRVTNVESIFPSEIRITIRERYPVFRYNISATQSMFFDNQLRFVTRTMPAGRSTVNITGQLGFSPVGLLLGEHLTEAIITEAQLDRLHRLVGLAELFWARNNFEDSLNHLFYSMEFQVHSGGVHMRLVRRDQTTRGPSPTQIIMQDVGIELNFRRMLTHIWDVLENYSLHLVGTYSVWIASDGRVMSTQPSI